MLRCEYYWSILKSNARYCIHLQFFFFYWMTFIILIIPFVTVLMFSTYTNILCNISSLLICNSHYNTIIFTSKMNCLIFFMSCLTQFKLGIFFFFLGNYPRISAHCFFNTVQLMM